MQQQPESNKNPSFSDDLSIGEQAKAIGELLRGNAPNVAKRAPKDAAPVDKQREPATIDQTLSQETEAGEAQAETPKKTAPKNLKELAERLGTEVSELYGLEIPDGSGKPHKLGELKDLLAQRDTITAKELELSERQLTESNNYLRQRQELESIVGMIPRELMKPELIERIRAERQRFVEQEVSKLVDAIPEWKDDGKRAADKQAMVAFMAEYGFEPHYLESAIDHRMLKLVRDSWQRKARIDKAMANVKETRDPPKAASRATGAPAKPALKVTGSDDRSKASAIAQLLRS